MKYTSISISTFISSVCQRRLLSYTKPQSSISSKKPRDMHVYSKNGTFFVASTSFSEKSPPHQSPLYLLDTWKGLLFAPSWHIPRSSFDNRMTMSGPPRWRWSPIGPCCQPERTLSTDSQLVKGLLTTDAQQNLFQWLMKFMKSICNRVLNRAVMSNQNQALHW